MIVDERTEKSLLGVLMQHPNPTPYLLTLCEDDMVYEDDKIILAAMQRLAAKRQPFDSNVVMSETERDQRYSTRTVPAVLECLQLAPSTVMVDSHFYRVKELSTRRQMQAIAQTLAEHAQDMGCEVDAAVAEAMDSMRGIGGTADKWRDMSAMVMAAYDDLERLSVGDNTYLTTGIADLDSAIGGLFPGEVTIIGARPAVGKSAMAAFIGSHLAQKGYRVGVCSLEMSPLQYIKRLLAAQSGVDGRKLRTGKHLSTQDWEQISAACAELGAWNMPFTFSVRTVEQLAAEARRRKDTKGLDLLVIDYMQLLKLSRPAESEFVRVSTVSHEIKQLALDLEIPILSLAQVTRPANKGQNTMPTLDSLRGSGDIEQDADNVLFLHRPEEVMDPSISQRHSNIANACINGGPNQYIVCDIAKQRNGETRMFDMIFDPAHMTYRCLS